MLERRRPEAARGLNQRDLVVGLARRRHHLLRDPVQRPARGLERAGKGLEGHAFAQARIQSTSGFAQRSRIALTMMKRKISDARVPPSEKA